jgi:hypothetical protein
MGFVIFFNAIDIYLAGNVWDITTQWVGEACSRPPTATSLVNL